MHRRFVSCLLTLVFATVVATGCSSADKDESSKTDDDESSDNASDDEEEDDAPKEKAEEKSPIEMWVLDLVGNDADKKKVAREKLKEVGEEAVPQLEAMLLEKCKLAKSKGDMFGAHDVMKETLGVLSLLERGVGPKGEAVLKKHLGEKEIQGGWGASFTTACSAS